MTRHYLILFALLSAPFGTALANTKIVSAPFFKEPAKIQQLTVGYNHSCALSDYGISCWGDNSFLQSSPPTGLRNVSQISAGFKHTCAISDTRIICWGSNQQGQLDVPSDIVAPTEIAAGKTFTCAIDQGNIRCWGKSPSILSEVPGLLVNPRQLRVSSDHACVITDVGLRCWGGHSPGVLIPEDLSDITEVAVGGGYTCVITDKRVKCWGTNSQKQIEVPEDITNPHSLTAGVDHSCVISENQIRCWGFNNWAKTSPSPWIYNPSVVKAGYEHSCAVTEAGIKCWGRRDGQTYVPRGFLNPQDFSFEGPFNRLCATSNYGVICHSDSHPYIDGLTLPYGTYGLQLKTIDPAKITKFTESDFTCIEYEGKIHCSNNFHDSYIKLTSDLGPVREMVSNFRELTCAIVNEEVVCWGGTTGPFGKKFIENIPKGLVNPHGLKMSVSTACVYSDSEPVCWGAEPIEYPSEVKSPEEIVPFGWNLCAIDDGKVYCWGKSNEFGDLNVPDLLKNPRQLVKGRHDACIYTDDGLKCWGRYYNEGATTPTFGREPLYMIASELYTKCGVFEDHIECWEPRDGDVQLSLPQGPPLTW